MTNFHNGDFGAYSLVPWQKNCGLADDNHGGSDYAPDKPDVFGRFGVAVFFCEFYSII